MSLRNRDRRRPFAVAFIACLVVLVVSPASAATADERMPVAGGTAALLRQCGIPGSVEPARALLVLARAIHSPSPMSTQSAVTAGKAVAFLRAARQKNLPVDFVPALLPLAVWQHDVFAAPVTADELAASILEDSRASFLYYGLFSLDEATLAFFVGHPSILTSIYRDHAGVFADFAESITVRDGRVVLPGDAGAAPIWESLAGAASNDPAAFIARLLGRDAGRLAWMFDTVAHLDRRRQDFALGTALGEADARRQYAELVYAAFAAFQPAALRLAQRPFARSRLDPPLVLATVGVTDDGRLAPPAGVGVWAGAFGVTGGDWSAEVDAPWLLTHVFTPSGRARLDALLFAQRLCAAGAPARSTAGDGAFQEIAAEYASHDALLPALERLGFVDPWDYVAALRAASSLAVGRPDASRRLAMFQGALALLVRLHEVETLDDRKAQSLARFLIDWPVGDSGFYGESLVQWFETQLLPALGSGRAQVSGDAEALLLDGLSGALAKRPTPVVQWEDQSYRVDLAAGERLRLRQMLDRQHAYPLDTALDLARLAASAQAADLAKLAELVSTLDVAAGAGMFGDPPAARRDAVLADVRQVQRGTADAGRLQAVRARSLEVLDSLLADVLAAHVYAIAIQDPESPLLLVDHPSRTHDFTTVGAWVLPRNVRKTSSSVLGGSLLGLDRIASRLSLRRMSLDSPPVAPVMGQPEGEALAESAAALNPFRLTDASRDAIVAALARGRARVAKAAADPAALTSLLDDVDVERWRIRLILWTAAGNPDAVLQYVSLAEIVALGAEGPLPADAVHWGTAQRALDGSFAVKLPASLAWHQMAGRVGIGLVGTRVADLSLHVAELLAQLHLPAALAHSVVQYATWDLLMGVQMSDLDDWLAVVRKAQALTTDQVADYVSALTADGTLVPVK